jgi:phospholipid/cholesterol/gamma-HCH transport system permease protein
VRWRDVWRICEQVGGRAADRRADLVPLGMILAFQSAVPMKSFGAEIFVADLIGLAMLVNWDR